MDLLHLFVYQPTPQLTLPLVHVASLYQQCYGRKLIPVVYGMSTLEGVVDMARPVSQVVKVSERVHVKEQGFQHTPFTYIYMYTFVM